MINNTNDKKIVTVQLPIMSKIDLEVLEIQIGEFHTDRMTCNGCRQPMGEMNPKGYFKTKEGWLGLCNKCCTDQGFIK